MKSIDGIMNYELIIVDMDGTLYFQKPLRYKMSILMLKGLILGDIKLREIIALFIFRRKREKLAGLECHEDILYSAVAMALPRIIKLSSEEVEKAVCKWIYEIPLAEIPQFKDYELIDKLKKAIYKNIMVYIYSDYPAENKASALGLTGVTCISSTDEEVGMLKPCPKGIESILERTGIDKSKAIMIGDRDETDGQAARNAGIDYIILNRKKEIRYEEYKRKNL